MANPDCYFLLQDGVSYHGHAVSGGRKTAGGPLALKRELRELSVQVDARRRRGTDELTAELEELERGTARLAEDLEYLRGLQQTEEKQALALDHEQRKLAEENARAGSRLSVARLELERLAREEERARLQREQSHKLVIEKEQARFDQEKTLEGAREEFERLQAHAHTVSGEEHSSAARGAGGPWMSASSSQKASVARLEAQLGQLTARRGEHGSGIGLRMGCDPGPASG